MGQEVDKGTVRCKCTFGTGLRTMQANNHSHQKTTRVSTVISRVQPKAGPDANRPKGATTQRSSGPRPFRTRFSGRYYGRIIRLCLISGQKASGLTSM